MALKHFLDRSAGGILDFFNMFSGGALSNYSLISLGVMPYITASIVVQLATLGLVDEYMLVLVPVLLGAGKGLFDGIPATVLSLIESRAFANGLVVNRYAPAHAPEQ